MTEKHKKKISEALKKIGHRPPLMLGDEHPNWKGDDAGYFIIHDWINKNWKKPDTCQHCGKDKKLDWANISGENKRSDRNDWITLCRSCHVRFDWNNERSARMSFQMKRYANSDEGRISMGRRSTKLKLNK